MNRYGSDEFLTLVEKSALDGSGVFARVEAQSGEDVHAALEASRQANFSSLQRAAAQHNRIQ